jgi:uncharacterized membrane protein YfcA
VDDLELGRPLADHARYVTEWLLLPLGLIVGAYGTVIGAGGGFILVPLLLFLYPEEHPAGITATSLLVVFFNAVSGTLAYARDRRIDYRTGATFAAATIPGAIAGALIVGQLPRPLFSGLFGLVLTALALALLFRAAPSAAQAESIRPGMVTRKIVDARGDVYQYSFYQWQGIALSFGVGFLSSLLGIGGGIIHVPVLVQLLTFPVHIATATSQFMLAIMALAGSLTHLGTGDLTAGPGLLRPLLLSVGVVAGAQVGARLSRRIRGGLILRLLAIALLLVGLRLLYAAVTNR